MLPKQVQEMADKASELLEGFGKDHPPADVDDPDGVAPEEGDTPEEPEAEPVEPSEEPEGKEPEEPEDQEDKWEHKYKVLKGKYDKEVPALHKEIKRLRRDNEELRARIALLEQMITQMRSVQESPEQPEDEEDEALRSLKENYPEIYTAISKLLEKKIKREVEPKVARTADEIFYAQLTALVPEWQKLNVDPDFLDWLDERDPVSGFTRKQLLHIAYEKRDAQAVANFFKKYLEEQRGTEEPEPATPPPATKAVAPPARRTKKSGKPTKKIWKQSEVEALYKKAALGKIDPNEWKKLEKELVEAALEGRVLYGK